MNAVAQLSAGISAVILIAVFPFEAFFIDRPAVQRFLGIEPHGGHESSTERSDSTYVDGNLDQRGVTATGPRQSEIAEGSLDEAAGADTSPRTDGRGRGDQH